MLTQQYIDSAVSEFQNAINHLKGEYARLQIGRASAALVEDLKVEAYGTMQPLKSLASISIPEPKTLQIQPWDKSVLSAVEKAIQTASIGLTPVNDGRMVRLTMPMLTEEKRKELVKIVHKMAEDCRISVRQSRSKSHEGFKALEQEKKISEDERRLAEKHLQEKVDAINKEIEELAKVKEKDILTI